MWIAAKYLTPPDDDKPMGNDDCKRKKNDGGDNPDRISLDNSEFLGALFSDNFCWLPGAFLSSLTMMSNLSGVSICALSTVGCLFFPPESDGLIFCRFFRFLHFLKDILLLG